MKQFLCAALLVFSVGWAQQNPSAVQQALQQAQAALEAGRLNEAVQGFEAVIARDFTNYTAHFGLGLALYRLGDLRGAAFEFTQLTVLDPSRFEGWFNLGVVRDRQGQAAEAAEAFGKAIEVGEKANLGPTDLKPAYVGQVKALRAQGQHEAAAGAARRGLEKLPGDPDLTVLLADSLVRAGKPLEALPLLYQVLGRDPSNVLVISQIADIYVAQGLPQRALREIDRGLEAAQDNAVRAQLLLKKSSLQQGRDQLASLQEAVRLDPKLWTAQYNLGVARLREGNTRGALEAFQSAYAQNPDDPRILLGLATTYDRLGQAAEAGRFAAMAARLSQGNERFEALFLQGKSAYTLRRYGEAVELLSQVTQQRPDNAEAWFLLGVSQFNLKDYAAAAQSLERAQSLAPSAATAANLGAALYSAGRYSDAERVLSQAVALDGRNPVAWYNLGLALRSLGRTAEARRAWQRSAELGYAPARELLR
ncbi:tetratricopeptide repeat protein [Meiothermus sp. QL-1]|uniref:tetratricopeptide repeat protein n=1 Tax=Meiothermus sp. QL-1 TaxID=2058095 RepID=UPI000E0A4E1A|nr:tetratricopeptide repeat protein [Meiothermus sp. QL-1]RDI96206.1 tetratricopeptide repeat protein [Meiothermus sp. QL-1]